MRPIIIHGKRISQLSPRHGRPEVDLAGVTRANAKFWNGQLLDWTEWWDLHPLVKSGKFAGIPERRPEAWAWYRRQDGTRPIFLQSVDALDERDDKVLAAERFSMVPGAVAYPLEEVQEFFKYRDGFLMQRFGCQVGHMIAYYLMQGRDTIIFNGLGCVDNIPYEHLHKEILFWMGVAHGRGCEIIVEDTSTYKRETDVYAYARHYGYDELEKARRHVEAGDRFLGMHEANEEAQRRGRPAKYGRSAFK